MKVISQFSVFGMRVTFSQCLIFPCLYMLLYPQQQPQSGCNEWISDHSSSNNNILGGGGGPLGFPTPMSAVHTYALIWAFTKQSCKRGFTPDCKRLQPREPKEGAKRGPSLERGPSERADSPELSPRAEFPQQPSPSPRLANKREPARGRGAVGRLPGHSCTGTY